MTEPRATRKADAAAAAAHTRRMARGQGCESEGQTVTVARPRSAGALERQSAKHQRERAAALQGKTAALTFLTGEADGQMLADGILAALAVLADSEPRTTQITVEWAEQRQAAEQVRRAANDYLSGESGGKPLQHALQHAVKLLVRRLDRDEQIERAWAELHADELDPAVLERKLAAYGW